MHRTELPTEPGWYIHASTETHLQCYRVALEGVQGHPELPYHAVVWSGGKQYRASELRGTWYGPLPLEALIREAEAGALSSQGPGAA
jgi:hypothetical protein